ncbi:xkdK-like tail sheath protein (endogenous virus) [Clostridium phage phiCT9441A]|uniref:tail sheath n=1 Tax=Clostridium phage phiCT9441A TaxID=1567014 RepID=UPI00051458D8|nr:phage tail sheath family protein [Clostridium tetani]YP_009219418.1 tail sheath [Clostridium phage phiCT9441A]AJA42665.1 xkdK-like tail sheath protein [Clostridium phage phiCT9441A]KGI40307.1 phage-like element PBSX protein XkdK [Clostridium tetani ATCC 9441]SUY66150.1 phage protein [Clostridium tetani]
MAGGTWEKQNKIRPGAYINFKSKKREESILGERGIVTMPLSLPWGSEKEVITIHADDDLSKVIGINITDDSALLIREVFKKAKTLLLYRLNEGTKATATLEGLTINAKYSGTKGNNITIVIQNNIDDTSQFEVTTIFEGNKVDKQLVKNIGELKPNDYVEFKGTGELKASAGVPLKGGTDGTVINKDYIDYLYDFNTMGITSKDESVKAIVTTFIKRQRERESKKVQAVLENYPEADHEGILSVKNGVTLPSGVISADQAVAFVAGATAGANVNKSNTYAVYDGAIDVDKRYTNREIEDALKNGEIVFTISNGKVVIEQDINTFKSFSKDKGKEFSKNRVIRTLDSINNDIKLLWERSYIGNGDNNTDGRNLFKKDIIKYLETLQGMNAVENVTPEDVQIEQGQDKDSVVAIVGVQPIDAMEKLYMAVEVE